MSNNTKTRFLTATEYVELDAMSYRLAHNIKDIEDCSCIAEEVAAGFVKADTARGSSVSINTHASLGEAQLNIVDVHDEGIWYGVRRVDGRCSMWAIKKYVNGGINQ